MRTFLSITLGFAALLAAPFALAQDPTPPSGTSGQTTGGTGQASGQVGGTTDPNANVTAPKVTPPANVSSTEPKKDDGITDHEKVVGKFGVGYLGLTQLPLGAGQAAGVTRTTLDAPVIGVRYWLMERLGIDGGIGFNFFSSSSEVSPPPTGGSGTQQTDGPAGFGIGLHAGLPVAFAYGKHYKFLLIPEVNVGFTRRGETQPNNQPDIRHGGFRLDAGARVGSEIQFGFIGVPELSLQASVGLGFRRLVWHNSQDAFGATPERSSSIGENAFSTSVQSDPWALFVNNISALYYFP
jgi:hypothetical protein